MIQAGEGSLLDVAVDMGIIKKAGAWFTYEGEQLGQGRENAKQYLRDTPQLMVEIYERVRRELAPGPQDEIEMDADGLAGPEASMPAKTEVAGSQE